MPLYDFRCEAGHRFERMVALADFDLSQECRCGKVSQRLISAPRFSVDKTDYTCPVTGKWIGSKHAHEENLRIHDCRVLESGEKEINAQSRKQADEAFDKSLEDSIDRELSTWDSAKMESLSNELVNGGVDLSLSRSSLNG